MEILKRSSSAFLALVLVLGMMPMSAAAAELEIMEAEAAENAVAEQVVETAAATEVTVATEAPTEATTVPTTEATEVTIPAAEKMAEGAVTAGTCGENLTWTFDEVTGTLTIEGTGEMDLNGGRPWEALAQDIISVVMMPGITHIDYMAFDSCRNLSNVVIPESVTVIDDWAFHYCMNLSEVDLPESLVRIGHGAFNGCYVLGNFMIPEQVTFIGDGAFRECGEITEVKIPASVSTIGRGAFADCGKLTAFEVSSDNVNYASENGVLYNKSMTRLIQWPKIIATDVLIPSGVETIGEYAFGECGNLVSVIIPDSVTAIEGYAFYHCSKLSEMIIPERTLSIGDSAFQNSGIKEIYFTGNAPRFGVDVFWSVTADAYYPGHDVSWTDDVRQNYSGNITWIPYDGENIENPTGSCGDNLTWSFEEGTKTLTISGEGSMYNYQYDESSDVCNYPWADIADEITTVCIEEGVVYLGCYAFANFAELRNVTISSSVMEIGNATFKNCVKLESVTIPNSIYIGESVFENCESLAEISLPQGLNGINPYLFAGCKSLERISIPAGILGIGYHAFADCTALKEIRFMGNSFMTERADLEIFSNVAATAYYPANNPTWTEEVRQNYGGTITWVPYSETPEEPDTPAANEITQAELEERLAQAQPYQSVSLMESVTLEEDLVLPENVPIEVSGEVTITVPAGVTLTVQAYLGIGGLSSLIVEEGGRLNIVGSSGVFVYANSAIHVYGECVFTENEYGETSLIRVYYEDGEFTTDFSGLGNDQLHVFAAVENEAQLVEGLAFVANGAYPEYTLQALNDLTLTEDITIPANCSLDLRGLTIEEGVTLVNRGMVGVRGDAVNNGTIINDQYGQFTQDSSPLENNGEIVIRGNGGLYITPGAQAVNYGTIDLELGILQVAGSLTNEGSIDVRSGSRLFAEGSVNNQGVVTLYSGGTLTGNGEWTGAEPVEPAAPAALTLMLDGQAAEDAMNVDMMDIPTLTFTAQQGAEEVNATWKSSNAQIAAVSGGFVQLKKPGKVTITAMYGSERDSVELTVIYADPAAKLTAASDIPTIGLQQGQSERMRVYGEDKEVTLAVEMLSFTSSNAAVASVDETGLITGGAKPGTAKITAAIKNDPLKRKVTLNVKVIAAQTKTLELNPTEVLLDKADLTTKESRTFTITPTAASEFGPMTLTGKSLKWTSSDTKLATVKANADGSATVTIAANKDGAATITAQSNDLAKVKATMNLLVYDRNPKLANSKVTLNPMMTSGTDLGLIEGYENPIETVTIDHADLAAVYDEAAGIWLLQANKNIKNSTIKTTLIVTSQSGPKLLPLTVTVKSTIPAITVKQNAKLDLFYTASTTTLNVTARNAVVTEVGLAQSGNIDFVMENGVISLSEGLLDRYAANPKYKPNTKATALIHLEGYKFPVEKSITISTTATKLTLTTDPTVSAVNVNPKFGIDPLVTFRLYNKAAKQYLDLTDEDTVTVGGYAAEQVTVDYEADTVNLMLLGNKKATLNVSVQKDGWSYPVTLKHTVNVTDKDPTVKLTAAALTLNSSLAVTADNLENLQVASTGAVVSTGNLSITGFEITPAKYNPNMELIQVGYNPETGLIEANIKPGEAVPATGTYTYTAVPLVEGARVKALSLKISITNKPPVVTVATKEKFDSIDPGSAITLNVTKITNTSSGITGARVKEGAEGSDLFEVASVDVENQTFVLKRKADAPLTKKSYKVVLEYQIGGKWFEAKAISVSVVQGPLEIWTQGSYQREDGQGIIEVIIGVGSPVGGQIERIAINGTKTSKEIVKAYATGEVVAEVDGDGVATGNLILRVYLKNADALIAGKSYNIVLNITPAGSLPGGKATVVTTEIRP